jgi:hypothetical protein
MSSFSGIHYNKLDAAYPVELASDTLNRNYVGVSRTGVPDVIPVVKYITYLYGLCHTRRVVRP